MNLLITLLTGLCFLMGFILGKFLKPQNSINIISISLAFIVLLNLVITDIIPDIAGDFSIYSLIFIIMGTIVLKLIDVIVPHHSHQHKEKNDDKKEHLGHLNHINTITVLALLFHNTLEAMALYGVINNSLKSGIMMALGIALHNIPLGFCFINEKSKKNILYLIILSLSGLFGGLLYIFAGSIMQALEHYILCFTLGMIIYLIIFEFLKELWSNKNNINILYGIMIGIVFVVITFII